MKVAIVGSSGYIAGYIKTCLLKHEAVSSILTIDKNTEANLFFDLERPEEFDYNQLHDVDIVIFTAAISSPDKCAEDFDYCWKINMTGTSFFINKAIKQNCKVLFFSSDAVFGKDQGKAFDEDSVTNAQMPYGMMKKAIEDQYKDEPMFKAIRLAYVTSAEDRFIKYCIDCIKRGEQAGVFHPFYRNCITITDVVDAVLWMIFNWEKYRPFVLNVCGSELVSRVRIADELNRAFGSKLSYLITTPDAAFYCNRPPITQMTSKYLWNMKIVSNNSFTDKIRKELEGVTL